MKTRTIRVESVTNSANHMIPRLRGATTWIIRDVDTGEELSSSGDEAAERERAAAWVKNNGYELVD